MSIAFWQALFDRATRVDGESLSTTLTKEEIDLHSFDYIEISFWPSLAGLEPDLVLFLQGESVSPLTVLIEVKLNAGKSGLGEDQLIKYLKLMSAQLWSHRFEGPVSFRPLIFLTEHSAVQDMKDSIEAREAPEDASGRLYGLQWQDILEVARSQQGRQRPDVLSEIARFLEVRNFDRFRGFHSHPGGASTGHFYEGYGASQEMNLTTGNDLMLALETVRTLHREASRLIRDLDSWMDKHDFVRWDDTD